MNRSEQELNDAFHGFTGAVCKSLGEDGTNLDKVERTMGEIIVEYMQEALHGNTDGWTDEDMDCLAMFFRDLKIYTESL